MAMAVHFYARFEKKNGSILLTRAFNEEETEDVAENIAHLKDICTLKDWRDPIISIEVGRALFSLLNGKRNILQRALQEADHHGEPLQLLIQGEECVPNVPFELVYHSQFLACSKVHILHHVSDYGCKREVSPENRPLKILFMACSAERVEPVLDYEKEEETILEVTEKFPVEVDVEDTGSLQGLADSLKLKKYDVVHLSGHATIREGNPVFVMEDEEGFPDFVTPDQLSEVLKLNPPRLVFLSGCRTGETPHHEAALSFAHHLVEEHSPTVLGWGLPVSDPGATRAAEILYFELGRGESLLKAVLSARRELSKKFPDWPLLRLFSDGTSLDRALVTPGQVVTLKPRDTQYAYLKHKQVKVLKKGFIGRRRQIQRGIRTLKDNEEKTGLLLHGTGGLGKSCLAGKFCERFKDHTLIVAHGRLEESTLLESIKDALIQRRDEKGQIILREQKEITEKIRMLCLTSFKQEKYLIVLDDFEKNLTGYKKGTPVLTEKITPILKVLLQYLPLTMKRTQVIITSRYTFSLSDKGRDIVKGRLECIGLTSFRGADERKKVYELKNILEYHDMKIQEELIDAGRGNPRLMEDLNTLVKQDIDVTELLQTVKRKQKEFIQQLDLKKILYSQSKEFQQILKGISVYRMPVMKEGLALACKGLQKWESRVERGVQLGLLEKDKRKVSYYWVTPLLREELLEELDEPEKKMYDEAACEYYQEVLSTSFVPEYAFELIEHGLQCGMTEPVISEGAKLLQYLRENLLYGSALREGVRILSNVSNPKEDESLSRFFFEFGWVLHDVGEARKAIGYYEKALKIDIGIYGENHPAVATRYSNLGLAWDTLGDSKKAIDYYEKALKIDVGTYGENHPAVATRYSNLGLAWDTLGDSKKAIGYYEKALKIDVGIYGENHPDVATDYSNLGSAWDALGDSKKAIDYYEKALRIGIGIYGENHPAVATDYSNLGSAWHALGDSKKAIGYYEKALRIGIGIYGENHPAVATRYSNLGLAWDTLGDSKKAIDYYEKALKIDVGIYGENHPDVATMYSNLGLAWDTLGDSKKAIGYLQRSYRIFRDFYGDNHPHTKSVKEALDHLCKK
jgi:tetratricopeptide (TPR) repeat protein